MTTRNGLNAAHELLLTDSRDEQTTTQPAAEPDDVISPAGQNETAEAGPPPETDLGSTQDALRTQLDELVQALSEKVETEPADERDDFQDDFVFPNVVNRTNEPTPEVVSEPEEWQPAFPAVSMDVVKTVLSKPLCGFVAGLVASAAVGGGVLLFTPLMNEPPALASNETSPDQTPVLASVTLRAEQPAAKMQGRLPSADEPQQGVIAASEAPVLEEKEEVEPATLAEPGKVADARSTEPLPATAPAEPVAGAVQTIDGREDAPQSEQTAAVDTVVTFDTIVKPSEEDEQNETTAENAAPATGEDTDSAEPERIAHAVTHVNMRAGPNNAEPVVAVVSEGSPVKVVQCNHWCEVIYSGRRGWIYGDLISMEGAGGNGSKYN